MWDFSECVIVIVIARTCWDTRAPACRYARTAALRCLDCRGPPPLLSCSVVATEVELLATHAGTHGRRWREPNEGDAESLLIEARTRHGRPPLTSHQSSGCLAKTRPDGSGWDKGVPRMTTPCRRTNGDLSPLQTTAAQVAHCAASKDTRQVARSIRFGICVWFMMGPQLFLQDWRCGQRIEEHARHKYRQRAGRGAHWPPGATASRDRCWSRENKAGISASPCAPDSPWRMSWVLPSSSFHDRHLQCAWKDTSDMRRNGSTDSAPSSLL